MELQVALPVSTLAKYKTAIQMVAIGFLLVDESGRLIFHYAPETGLGLLWLAAGLPSSPAMIMCAGHETRKMER